MKFAMILLFTLLQAAPADAPVLSELEQTKLRSIELEMENVVLRIQGLQAKLTALEGDAKVYLKSLEKPGYVLQRDEKTNRWQYQPIVKQENK